jgi:hypothetical protein
VEVVYVLARVRPAAAAAAGVVEALHVNDARHALAPRAVHRHRHGPGGVEAACEPLHGRDDARAPLGALLALLVAERPEND